MSLLTMGRRVLGHRPVEQNAPTRRGAPRAHGGHVTQPSRDRCPATDAAPTRPAKPTSPVVAPPAVNGGNDDAVSALQCPSAPSRSVDVDSVDVGPAPDAGQASWTIDPADAQSSQQSALTATVDDQATADRANPAGAPEIADPADGKTDDQAAAEPEPAPDPADRPSTFAALHIRNYRLFFSGQVVSNTGTWMQRIAQDWLVLQITNSPLAVGITTALQFLPMLLFGLWGGLLVDRYPKRRLLLITQTAMGSLAAILAGLTLAGVVEVWQVYLIAFGLGLATVVDNPARQTFVNELVPKSLVRNAVSLNSGNFQLARMVGPAVAGVLISVVGIGYAFAFNAVSYLAVIAALGAMRVRDLQKLPLVPRGPGQLREGLRYVWRTPALLWPVVLVFFVGTFGYNFAIILSAYTKNVFDAGADVYGLLNTMLALGSVAGALMAARRVATRLWVLFAAAASMGLGLVLLGLTPWFIPFVILLVAVGFISVTFNTLGNTSVQLASDPELRGRVMSLYMLVFMGGTPVGSLIVGAITDRWGAPIALVLTGTVCVVAAGAAAVLAARSAGLALRVDRSAGAGRRIVLVRRKPIGGSNDGEPCSGGVVGAGHR
ncbi:MAG TPA: MFS transporter [Nakamurella sp.]|nr:MFS transporter [Nakamurella sp.]